MKKSFKMGMMAVTLAATGAMVNVAYQYHQPEVTRTIASEEAKEVVGLPADFKITDIESARKVIAESEKNKKFLKESKAKIEKVLKSAEENKSSYAELYELKSEYNEEAKKFENIYSPMFNLHSVVTGNNLDEVPLTKADFSEEEIAKIVEFSSFLPDIKFYETMGSLDQAINKAQSKILKDSEAKLCKTENLLDKMSEQLEELLQDKKDALAEVEKKKKEEEEKKEKIAKFKRTQQFASLIAGMISPMMNQFQYSMGMFQPMAYTNPLNNFGMPNIWSSLMEDKYRAYGQGPQVVNNHYYAQNDGFFGRDNFVSEPFIERSFSRSDDSSRLLVPDFGRDFIQAETININ